MFRPIGLVLAVVSALGSAPVSAEGGLRGLEKAVVEAREILLAEGSPVRFDKAFYSCSDKVRVFLAAPGWNSSPHRIDSLGGDSENPIKISTRKDRLSPYRLSETGPDTGIFAGQFVLRCSGNGAVGSGGGPHDGVLGAGPDDVLTFSFKYAEGRFLRTQASIGWTGALVGFDKTSYAVQESALIRVRDSDMNLNPEAPDRVEIVVYSDSDMAGAVLSAIETGNATGDFAGSVFFSANRPSSGERLHVAPGNTVYAVYVDRTLPPPAGSGDSRRVTATAVIR